MVRFIFRRFLYMLLTIWMIISVTFVLMHNLPGDPFANSERLTDEQKAILLREYGLDKPIWEQYVKYVGDTVRGDLGVSYQFPTQDVVSFIKQGFPASAELGMWAILTAIIVGLSLGIVAALNHNKTWDRAAILLAIIGVSVPSFVLAPLLSYFVGVKLEWLPTALWKGPEYRILPTIALSFGGIAYLARLMRTSMLDVVNQDFIKTAKAKGLSKPAIVVKHTIRNAIMPVVTVLGPTIVNLMTGTLVVELVFAIPGLGQQFVQSIYTNDYTMISGLTIFYSVLLVLAIFVTDILYGFIDPRIRLTGGKGK